MPPTHATYRNESDSTSPAGDDTLYQTRLAESLLASLGTHEAIHVCQENGWEGVLQVILALQRTVNH